MTQIKSFIIYILFVILILAIAEISFGLFKIKNEFTRKFAHITIGLSTIILIKYVTSLLLIFILTFSFLMLLVISKKYKLLKSIDQTKRTTFGSYLFPVSIFFCFAIYRLYDKASLFVIPITILSISDTIAAIIGTAVKSKKIQLFYIMEKTVAGSLTFFLTTCIILSFLLPVYYCITIFQLLFFMLIISCLATFVEMFSTKGFDNLTVPILVSLLLILMELFL